MASQIEKDGVGGPRGGNLRPEDILNRHTNYRDMHSKATLAHIAWLKESIRLEGVKKPIDVSYADGKWYLEAGECRLTAAQALRKEGWDGYIPCFQVKGDEANILARSIIDNTGLTPTLLEIGVAFQHLVDYGWPIDRVAACVPPSITTNPAKALQVAKKALDLNAAPLDVKKAVREGVGGVRVSEAAAVSAVRKSPLQAAQIITEDAHRAKAAGKTVLRRPKGAGKATKAKAETQKTVDHCLKLADALAAVALDDDLDRSEVKRSARAYSKARGL